MKVSPIARIALTVGALVGPYAGTGYAQAVPPQAAADASISVLTWPAERLVTGHKFTEGVAVMPNGDVYYSDIPPHTMHAYTPSTGEVRVFQPDSRGTNGQLVVPEHLEAIMGGRLIACEDRQIRQIWVYRDFTDPDSRVPLVETYRGKKFNGPNDLTLWDQKIVFSDPLYGHKEQIELDHESVYVFDPVDGSLQRLNHPFVRPNGMMTSPDGRYIYIVDHGDRKLFRWDTATDDPIQHPKIELFCVVDADKGGMDGLTIDAHGNIYATVPRMKLIAIISPEGKQIAHLPIPEGPSNCTLTPDGKTLYVTARQSLYAFAVGALPAE